MADIEKARKARFKTAEEIEAAIDKQKALVVSLTARAYTKDQQATTWFKKWSVKPVTPQQKNMLARATKARTIATKLRHRADKIDGGYLTRLKSKLAVMRTKLLPGMGDDESIPKR